MKRLIDLESYPVQLVLDRLLQDKTTKQNIIFATDAYSENGEDFAETSSITVEKLLGFKNSNQNSAPRGKSGGRTACPYPEEGGSFYAVLDYQQNEQSLRRGMVRQTQCV